ncbi:MAG TPA: N-acetylmuramoyl-L-alanine amidase [Verrucomicrobiae bacterium]|nr:N-acetylmuramoyl-L-alanine amidase [Verrucomicrobiae bacterium]
MFKFTGIIFLGALLFLAGCASTPTMPEETISSPEPSAGASALNWVDPNAPPIPRTPPVVKPNPPQNPPPAVISNRPMMAMAKPAPAPVTTWTSLPRWAVDHKLAPPVLVSKSPLTTYRVNSDNGVLMLALGSREAIWNGIEIHLGFEPQLIDNQVFVHGLDLQKTFEPLLCAPPLTLGTNRVIVIDPGHGGSNVGTHSVVDGRYEKEFTLDWARRLKPLLETNGWTVYLTRTGDSYVTNTDRAVFADAHRADLFISLHFNSAAPDTKQAGLETYVLTPTGMPSTLKRNYNDLWSDHFSNNNFDAANLLLAVRLQASLLRATGEEDRGVRRARFMDVLHGHDHPAVLIEGGYLSNPREARRIADPEFRQKLAEAVAAALRLNPDVTTPKPENAVSAVGTNHPSIP